jgi:hypothetical protein
MWCAGHDLLAHGHAILADRNRLGLVDVAPPQPGDLAAAQPAQRQRPQVPVAAVVVEDREHVPFGE